MRKGHLGFAGVLALVGTTASVGCDSETGPSTSGTSTDAQSTNGPGTNGMITNGPTTNGLTTNGPTTNGPTTNGPSTSLPTGAGSNPGAPMDCVNAEACGGNVVGTWNVTSSCLELSGDMDVFLTSLACSTVPATGYLQTTGTFVANADGTYSDNTTTTGVVTFPLDSSCLAISGVDVDCSRIGAIFSAVGWKTADCTGGAGACNCSLSTEQEGGLGVVLPYTEPNGQYTTSGSTLTASNATYSYCSAEDTLTLMPQMAALKGTVVLQREGTDGSPVSSTGGMTSTSATASMTSPMTSMSGAGGMDGAGGMSEMGGAGGMSEMGGAGGMIGASGSGEAGGGSGGMQNNPPAVTAPCDIYEASGHTCVAAHSTIRALFGSYDGNLYQVRRADGMTQDIPVLAAGGFADSSQQDTFCSGSSCTIVRIYDQSGHGNFLEAQTPDSTVGGFQGQTAANAAAESLTVGGHQVYSLYTRPAQAYWNDGSSSGMPLGAEPQGVYMVTSGEHFNGGCCYNYGNGQTSRTYEGGPTMDSVYFGNNTIWGTGVGDGPWVMADMEDGIVSGNNTGQNPNLESLPFPFVTAMEKNNGTSEFAIKGADATDPTLNTYYQGALPAGKSPMRKEGGVLLGAGGDCCYSNNNASEGTFYEGAIVAGYPSDATDEEVHANIVEVGYGE
jgi:non-reducing end alpha-L-arabinofuranosidase